MIKRCSACMRPLETPVCPSCGYDELNMRPQAEFLLPAGTLVKKRYTVGLPLEKNGESIVYIGFDEINNRKVRIREFFPDRLCCREEGNFVAINSGSEIQFKALMTDYVELSRQLMDLSPSSSIIRAIDLLADNGTIYTIYENYEGITLNEYLRTNGGELSWEDAEPMFMPLFYAIKMLNSNGIIHRGISPETIIVTRERELKLKGICTSAVRAINTEITYELYQGYAAPEQYQKCTSHGEWTDLYSISAVLYRTLTGTAPASGETRDPDIAVMPPKRINPNIPSNVSDAIVKGLAYAKADRTWSIKDFITDLYSQPARSPINIHDEAPPPVREKSKFHVPVWLIVILIALPIMFFLFFVLYNSVLGGGMFAPSSSQAPISSEIPLVSSDLPSSDVTSSQPESVAPLVETVVVTDFSGKYYEDVIATVSYTNWFKFEKKEKYSETAQIGEVISQNVEPKKMVEKGTKIILTVSKGKQTVLLPPLTDESGNPIPLDDYKKYLIDNGLKVKIEKIDSISKMSGEIDSLNVPTGTNIDRDVIKEIVIYVAN